MFAVSGDVDAPLHIAWTHEDPQMRQSADRQLL